MVMDNTKLTSVKILKALYHRFKENTVNSNMSLQKLVNRSIFLYVNDKDYYLNYFKKGTSLKFTNRIKPY